MFPLLLMELLGDYPGIPGLYTAAVFAAALRYLSAFVTDLRNIGLVLLFSQLHNRNNNKEKKKNQRFTLLPILFIVSVLFAI